MNETKFFAIFIGAMIGLVALVIFIAGIPSHGFYHFEDSGVVCKKWNETWKLNYDHSQCWQLEKIQNANQN